MATPAKPRKPTGIERFAIRRISRGIVQPSPRLIASRMNGAKGGRAKLERHGVEAFQAMGEKGGARMVEKYSKDFFQVIGIIGGQRTRERHQQKNTTQ